MEPALKKQKKTNKKPKWSAGTQKGKICSQEEGSSSISLNKQKAFTHVFGGIFFTTHCRGNAGF